MRVAIFGAGCIGSLVGCKLRAAGTAVTFIDLKERAARIRDCGITICHPDGGRTQFTELAAVDSAALRDADPHDIVVIALKAHQIAAALDPLTTLIGPRTVVVTMQNGIPWWYFAHQDGPYESRTIEAADPGGRIRARIDTRQVVGCIAYPAVAMNDAAEVLHVEGNRMPVGPVDPAAVAGAETVSRLFVAAGFKSPLLDDLRDETWLKAIGNMSLNPISALTHSTLVEICEHADTRSLVQRMMSEAEAVAKSLGARLRVSIERRIEGARRVGSHRSSMLQDVQNGVAMEVEALVAAVVELGELTGTPTPSVRTVLALTRLLNETVARGPSRIVALPAFA